MRIDMDRSAHPTRAKAKQRVARIDNERGLSIVCSTHEGAIREINVDSRGAALPVLREAKNGDSEDAHAGAILGRYPITAEHITDGRKGLPAPSVAAAEQFRTSDWTLGLRADGNSAMIDARCALPSLNEPLAPRLECHAQYQLTTDNELAITYHARAKQQALVSLAHNFNWNMNVEYGLVTHEIAINSKRFSAEPLMSNLQDVDMVYGGHPRKAVDHTLNGYYMVDQSPSQRYRHKGALTTMYFALLLREKNSGRCMELFTDFPMIGVSVPHKVRNRKKAGVFIFPIIPLDSPKALTKGGRGSVFHCLYRFKY